MPDITKCGDKKCPVRKSCWRYVAPSSYRQAYADFQREEAAEKCEEGFYPLPTPEEK